jgi:hypothetical protein
MKSRKSFRVKNQRVNVRVTKNRLQISSTFENKEVANLTVEYPSIEEAQERFDKYDKDNADAFVSHFNNPYLINK